MGDRKGQKWEKLFFYHGKTPFYSSPIVEAELIPLTFRRGSKKA